jgi:hypothetical protein
MASIVPVPLNTSSPMLRSRVTPLTLGSAAPKQPHDSGNRRAYTHATQAVKSSSIPVTLPIVQGNSAGGLVSTASAIPASSAGSRIVSRRTTASGRPLPRSAATKAAGPRVFVYAAYSSTMLNTVWHPAIVISISIAFFSLN